MRVTLLRFQQTAALGCVLAAPVTFIGALATSGPALAGCGAPSYQHVASVHPAAPSTGVHPPTAVASPSTGVSPCPTTGAALAVHPAGTGALAGHTIKTPAVAGGIHEPEKSVTENAKKPVAKPEGAVHSANLRKPAE
jgi:hypothetical protein